jgi:uncharacterized phage protein gp47/JayE
MSFGVVDSGFNIKRLQDIKTEIENELRAIFGEIDLSPESVFGQLVGVFSKPSADVWEQMQKIYLNQSPSNAEGVALDFILDLNGLTRLPSKPTEVYIGLDGTFGTIIPVGAAVKSSVNSEIYQANSQYTITNISQLRSYVKIDNAIDSTLYQLIIDATTYDITSGSSSTPDSIAQQLVDDINVDPLAIVIAKKLVNGVIQIDAKNVANPYDILVDINMLYYMPAIFYNIVNSDIAAPANTIDIIETPIAGLDFVNNFEDGIRGRWAETDAEARLRRTQSLQITGGGTLPAIVARMLDDVENVTAVKGFENRTDVVDVAGRPPHSIEIVVVGGTDDDIANQLWKTKGGGIQTFGNTSYVITDENGDPQTMYFSRAVPQYAHVDCQLTLYAEEDFPVDGPTQVQQKILEYGSTLEIGVDMIPQRFFGSIYDVPGIATITFNHAITSTPGGTPTYTTAIITIDETEIATYDLSRIAVSVI